MQGALQYNYGARMGKYIIMHRCMMQHFSEIRYMLNSCKLHMGRSPQALCGIFKIFTHPLGAERECGLV